MLDCYLEPKICTHKAREKYLQNDHSRGSLLFPFLCQTSTRRAIEVTLMLNCLYMALLVTNYMCVARRAKLPFQWYLYMYV